MNLPLNWLAGWDFFHQQYLFPAWLNIFGGNTFKADLITASPGGTAISGTLLNSNMAEELQNLLPVLEPKIQIWQKKMLIKSGFSRCVCVFSTKKSNILYIFTIPFILNLLCQIKDGYSRWYMGILLFLRKSWKTLHRYGRCPICLHVFHLKSRRPSLRCLSPHQVAYNGSVPGKITKSFTQHAGSLNLDTSVTIGQ